MPYVMTALVLFFLSGLPVAYDQYDHDEDEDGWVWAVAIVLWLIGACFMSFGIINHPFALTGRWLWAFVVAGILVGVIGFELVKYRADNCFAENGTVMAALQNGLFILMMNGGAALAIGAMISMDMQALP